MGEFLPVVRVIGLVLVLFSGTMVLPLAMSWALDDGAQHAYDEAIVVTLAAGAFLSAITWRHQRELKVRDGYLIVVFSWALLPLFAAIPLLIYLPTLSFTDAYFECMSGLTTTGATVLSNLDRLPPSINVWRAQMHWVGGLGIILLAVAILPLLGVGGRQLLKAEAPGPMKDTKLTPRIAETAKGLWTVYIVFTLLCWLGFMAAGLDWIEALVHTFSVMGLGGFSSHDASLGFFNSPAVEAVAALFALLAGLNWATHFIVWRQRSLMFYLRDSEVRVFLLVLGASCVGVALVLRFYEVYPDFLSAFRFAAFNVISMATTLGLVTTDFAQWPFIAPLWMLFLCSFITCSGSTGGGIKMMRAIILYKQVFRELIRSLHPNVIRPVKLGRETVPNNIVFAVLAFAFVYMASLVSLTLVLVASGLDVVTAFSAVVACINNTGPGLGQVGPSTTYAVLTDFQTWVLTFAMMLGRLELFTLLVVLTPAFWRK
ncbi:MAG: TrkH family potassium uptake protein [Pseudomonadota bacterium]